MTEVAFHFNAPERLAYACRLIRKAYGAGAQVVVTGDERTLDQLDAALWSFAPLEFVPHASTQHPAAVLYASPVVLAAQLRELPHHQVLVNLGAEVPTGFEQFERVIEVVTASDADRSAARSRWKHYAERGYDIQRHDLGSRSA
jgi:DNA polymerase III subunit chi